MRQYKFGSALLMTMILVGCGGGGSDLPAKSKFSSQVSFGDSLSDVGSYKVGLVNGIGGGQFSINGANASGQAANGNNITNWTEQMAMSLGLPAPCAALTGLDNGSAVTPTTPAGTPAGTVISVSDKSATCSGYAQGGARVTEIIGIGNKSFRVDPKKPIGFALTVPVVTQIANHLAAHGGKFSGTEVVTVMAGANDVLFQLNSLKFGAIDAVAAAVPAQIPNEIALGHCLASEAATVCVDQAVATLTPTVGGQYLATNAPLAVQAIGLAASQLVVAVNAQILANGAKFVTVVNIPDIGTTPFAATLSASSLGLVNTMVTTFNTVLKNGLAANTNVLFVDANTASHDETVNPASYDLSNVKDAACGVNPLALTSLGCKASNLITDAKTGLQVKIDDHYLFADDVHPTPYGHFLFSQYVLQAMGKKGWN
jgi:outer membrane lipase/esterase